MSGLVDLLEIVKKALEEAERDFGKINVLMAGRTGVGKSTLINSVFRGSLATTGQGEPVTQTTRLLSKQGVPLAIWDTRGLEMADFAETLGELTRLVEMRLQDPNPHNHVHVAWLCLHEDGRRVEAAERDLCRTLAKHVPVIAVITKARRDDGFRAEVQRLLPNARSTVRVRAIAEKFDDPVYSLPPMGLEDLVEATSEVLPEAILNAHASAVKAGWAVKRKRAHVAVAAAAAKAAAAAAVPIPFADAALLVPIQVTMLASISILFGIEISKATLSVLVAALTGTAGTAVTGRIVVANLVKLIPGGGAIVGGMISAATAVALTTALGEIYIASLVAVVDRAGGEAPAVDAVKQEFKRRMARRSARYGSLFEKFRSMADRLLGRSGVRPST